MGKISGKRLLDYKIIPSASCVSICFYGFMFDIIIAFVTSSTIQLLEGKARFRAFSGCRVYRGISEGKIFVSNGILVTHTHDGLSAFCTVLAQREKNYPTDQELFTALKDAGVIFGVNKEAVQDMAAMKTVNQKVEIARGISAEPGIAGRIEMLIDVGSIGKPKMRSGDRADFHDICFVINVRKGDPVARRVPPVLGKEGTTVQGKPIAPPLPKDVRLPAGVGTEAAHNDPDLLVAATDGGIGMEPGGLIIVRKEEKIMGDIDYQTGDVKFSGDLTVTGTVRAGFSIETKGNLFIGGSVEDSSIRSKGTVVIKRGAVGAGNGSIECLGAMRVRHLENFRVTAGADVVVDEDMVNATVQSDGIIYAKSIRGGCVTSMLGVEAGEIGSSNEIKTIVDIGKKYERMQARYRLLSRLASLTTEIEKNRELVFQFVRDNLDDTGTLSVENETMLTAMKVKTAELNAAYSATQTEIEKLDNLQFECEDSYIKAEMIYPNTIVKFGVGEQLIREPLRRVRLMPVEKGATVALVQETVDF
jgi:uncharacterized protein (DUF342 family)